MEEQLGKFFSGEATEREVEEVMRWRNESAENAELFFLTKNLWISSEQSVKVPPAGLLDDIIGEVDDVNRMPDTRWQYLPWAAVIALLLGFGWWTFLRGNIEGVSDELLPMVEIFQLDDGSELTLYKGSTFSVLEMSDEQRVVEITGRGYFDVARDESRPFVVYAEDAKVQVLGTSFVVDTRAAGTEVLVASGTVSMAPQRQSDTEAIVLEQGDRGLLVSDQLTLSKQRIENENFMAWSSGILSFDQEQLSDVSAVLKEVYGLDVTFGNKDIAGCQLTAKYKRKSGEEVVRLIADTFDMKYRITGQTVEFSGRGCR